jgi:hypothetical protein
MEPEQQEMDRQQLRHGFSRSGMSYQDLWWQQFAIGGDASALELEAYLLGLLKLSPYQHDLIAQALNEHYLDHDEDHPVAYSGEGGPEPPRS